MNKKQINFFAVFALLGMIAIPAESSIASPAKFAFLKNQAQIAMAKTPKRDEPVEAAKNMSRYIVTHNCKKSEVSQISKSVGKEPFSVLTVFEFTGQFLIETTSAGASKLRKHRCVKQVEEDRAVPPASSG